MIKCPFCEEKTKTKKEKRETTYDGITVRYTEIYFECKNGHQLQTKKMFEKSYKNFKRKFKKARGKQND